MLEKNKDYIEMRVSSTDCAFTQNAATTISIEGFSYNTSFRLPDPGESYVIISKEKFDQLQTENEQLKKKLSEFDFMGWMESAKLWKGRYNDLSKLVGFSSEQELEDYLVNETECDTLHEAILKLKDQVKYTCDEWRDLSKKLEECEKDYISERDKADALQTENEQLKKKLEEFSPIPEYKEFLMHLYSVEDAEKLEWVLRHVSGGMASTNEWIAISKFWKNNYAALSELVGFSSVEELEDYLVNETECDTLHEAMSKLHDEVKCVSHKWASANRINNSWKAAAECNSPKELIEKREALEKEIEVYSRALQEWKEGTGCPSPSSAKDLIESGASWHHAYIDVKVENEKLRELEKENADLYAEIRKWKDLTKSEIPEAAATWISSYESACGRGNRLAEMVEKLKEEVVSWKNVTGYSTPEDYMHARISGAFHTLFDYTAAWQKATDCDTPEQVKERIKALNERIDESEADYNHLLMLTGFDSEGEIEDALDQCDHSTLRKALVDYEFDYEELLKLTGYKSNQDIRVALNHSEQFVYETMRELISSLKRNAKFTESNWQHATGCDTPGMAEEKFEYYKKRLGNAVQAASCATKHLENITF